MKKRVQILLHVALWLGLIGFYVLYVSPFQSKIPWHWQLFEKCETFLFSTGLFYFNWFVLVPRILARNKVVFYAIATVATLAIYAGVRTPIELYENRIVEQYFPDSRPANQKPNQATLMERTFIQLAFMGILNIFLSSSLKVTGDYLKNEQLRKDLEHQQVTTELELLKSQVNPHFLFNTLNNLYSLAYQNSPKTPDAIMKLSLLLRYQLYETNAPFVSLENEVEHLQHLLDLHQLRLPDPSLLNLQVEGNISLLKVPPMLLMPLVENVFKHSLTSAPMKMHLILENDTLSFTSYNQSKANRNSASYGGLGLQNLKRRLELIYPGQYTLTTQQEDQRFMANLTLTRISA